jgi:hypothetical protein
MVKEVSVHNNIEMIKTGYSSPPYSNDPESDMITAYLSDEGKTLHIDVDREVPAHFLRMVHLWYANVDVAARKVEYNLLATQNPVFSSNYPDGAVLPIPSSSHTFDISAVLTIPTKLDNIPPAMSLTVELFTFEANIADCNGTAIYGTKRLSVPYRSSLSSSMSLPISTDGWYPLGVVDYAARDINRVYTTSITKGDIVFWYTGDGSGSTPTVGQLKTGKLYTALQTTNYGTTTEGYWREVTEEDILRMSSLPLPVESASAAAVIGADMLITRYIKHHIIYDMMSRTGFGVFNNQKAVETLSIIRALREQAISFMGDGDRIRAIESVFKITDEYNAYLSSKNTIDEVRVSVQYTI